MRKHAFVWRQKIILLLLISWNYLIFAAACIVSFILSDVKLTIIGLLFGLIAVFIVLQYYREFQALLPQNELSYQIFFAVDNKITGRCPIK